jgi:3-hydroxyisobutyrate dehydrogenase
MNTVGFIGLGNMGSGMAANLLKAGLSVTGFDSDLAKTANIENLTLAESVSEVAQACEVIVLCLPNPEVSKDVLEQLLDTSTVKTVVETSTLTPEIVEEFAKKAIVASKQFLSAPMVGGKNQAAEGTIEFLVESDEAVLTAHQSLFEAMGKARYMGTVPSATLAKLTFNLCRYANLATAVEAYRLLQAYGANTKAIYEFMSEQSLDNFGQVWTEDMKDMMTKDIPFKPSQVPKKDLALIMEMAKTHDVADELPEAIRNTYLSME